MKHTDPEYFMKYWEDTLPTIENFHLKQALEIAFPSHPNPNMRWLYDRVLMEIAERAKRGEWVFS